MSTTASGLARALLLAALAGCSSGAPVETPGSAPFGFGRSASAEEIARADVDVRFDGVGLPAGSGRAQEGAVLYRARCAACHGGSLEGNPQLGVRPLVGDVRHAVNNLPFAPPLFGYIRRAMPLDAPGGLSDDEVYALVAFLLERAGVRAAGERPLDAGSLAAVEMPNRTRFFVTDGVEVAVPEIAPEAATP